jgi:F0F1-type ATP synthase membrane subunit a
MNPATVILAEGGGSGMSFMIRHLVDFELFGQKLSITTTHIAIAIVDLILILFALAVYIRFKHPQDVPGPFQTLAEFLVEFIGNFVSDNMGPKNGKRFLNYTGSIFLSMFFHFGFNFYSVAMDLIGIDNMPEETAGYVLLGLLVVCIVLTVITMMLFLKKNRPEKNPNP